MNVKCKWTADYIVCGEPTGNYDTLCGNDFVLNEGTVEENHMKFCPFCGEEIEAIEQPKEEG